MSPSTKEPFLDKGTVLNGKWEIVEHIATGGMAEVYRARQINLDRQVAIKIMSEDFLDSFEGDEEEIQAAWERFHREVLVMAQVRHPNVLQVYDQDRAVVARDGRELTIEYIAMEYVPGPNLRSTMPTEGLLDNEQGIRDWIRKYFMPILDGMETVHALGIVHRDLKPENVLLEGFTPKIMDFGLAGGTRWRGLTQNHHMFGTIQYIAPEQLMDLAETDVRGDIYSLGKILYEAVSGKMTKEKAFPLKTPRLPNPDTPFLKRLDRVIQQATAEDKAHRIPSVAVFREALVEILEWAEQPEFRLKPSVTRLRIRRSGFLLGALAIIVGISIGLHILYHRERTSPPAKSIPQSALRSEQGQALDKARTDALIVTEEGKIEGKDGAELRLIPAGEFTFPGDQGVPAGKTVKVEPFYMDETEVTNHQYVEFLNQVLAGLRVEDGVVRANGDIWLLLGKVKEGYEPIVFRDGRFYVKNPEFASNPVVRVTGYGAAAYAHFYGRRLPTEVEWLHAASGGAGSARASSADRPATRTWMDREGSWGDMQMMHEQMMESSGSSAQHPPTIPSPVGVLGPNAYGLRGMHENVSEWATRSLTSKTKKTGYVVLGGLSGQPKSVAGVRRYRWEAFEEVGFRCAIGVNQPK